EEGSGTKGSEVGFAHRRQHRPSRIRVRLSILDPWGARGGPSEAPRERRRRARHGGDTIAAIVRAPHELRKNHAAARHAPIAAGSAIGYLHSGPTSDG